ncbi:MAG: antibiotic biosynthesis monooxygenase [Candidatus Izimaplasma sp.]|nr:antibiotic biosynthesis monooxygenase [Candidatus Izimaplasma bacterium]
MSKRLPLIVKFKVKQDKLEFVKSELLKILEPTRNEDGCILYELHQDIDNPCILMFYEIWRNEYSWRKHDNKQHIINFKKAIEGSVESITFNKLTILNSYNKFNKSR